MLTSFFSKSSPVNYLILSIWVVLGYIITLVKFSEEGFELISTIQDVTFAGLLVFIILLLDFVIRKNHLTKNNTYGIFFFCCFLLALPMIFLDKSTIVATIFLFLAFRRILSLNNRNTAKKIFDASFWIGIAAIFQFWSILFYVILYMALVNRANRNYKQFLIPLVGVTAVLILLTTYLLVWEDSLAWFSALSYQLSVDFIAYNKMNLLIPTTLIMSLFLWTGGHRVLKLSSLQKKERPSASLVLLAGIIGISMALLSHHKNGSELFLFIGPTAILVTNYIEKVEETWFKEVLLWCAFGLPFAGFLL